MTSPNQQKRVVAQYSYVDPSKIGQTRPEQPSHEQHWTTHFQPLDPPPPEDASLRLRTRGGGGAWNPTNTTSTIGGTGTLDGSGGRRGSEGGASFEWSTNNRLGSHDPTLTLVASRVMDEEYNPPPVNPELFTHMQNKQRVDTKATSTNEAKPIYVNTNQYDKSSDRPTVHTPRKRQRIVVNDSFKRARLLAQVIVPLIIAIGAYYVYANFYPTMETAVLVEVSWTRYIDPQVYQYNEKEGWTIPAGALLDYSEPRISRYEDIIEGVERSCTTVTTEEPYQEYDHTDTVCFDDGTCEHKDIYVTKVKHIEKEVCKEEPITRKLPVTDHYYYYHIWEWVPLTRLVMQGKNNEPTWPQFYEDSTHRVASSHSSYKATFRNSEGMYFDFDIDSLEAYYQLRTDVGSSFDVERNSYKVTHIMSKIQTKTKNNI